MKDQLRWVRRKKRERMTATCDIGVIGLAVMVVHLIRRAIHVMNVG